MFQTVVTYTLLIAALFFIGLKLKNRKKKVACDSDCACKSGQM